MRRPRAPLRVARRRAGGRTRAVAVDESYSAHAPEPSVAASSSARTRREARHAAHATDATAQAAAGVKRRRSSAAAPSLEGGPKAEGRGDATPR